MVLLSGQPTACWGWGDVGATISVRFIAGNGAESPTATAVVSPEHKWSLSLPVLTAGQSGRLEVASSSGDKITIGNVIVGEVWLGSGQSNMSYLLSHQYDPPEFLRTAQQEAARPDFSIRFFITDRRGADSPVEDVSGSWVVAAPDNVGKCSAVAWNLAIALRRELRTPVGLIVSAVGATPVEAWLSSAALETNAGASVKARHAAALADYTPDIMAKYKALDAQWRAANPTPELKLANGNKRPREPYSPTHNYVPSRFYNAMIHGLAPYTVRGIAWFQADGNNSHPEEYPELIRSLILSWRKEWKAELPFYYVEMNNMHAKQQRPVEPAPLCLIREAQMGALALPKTGVVAAIDVGIENAHFPNKKAIGERLAGLALAEIYGRGGLVCSPEYQGAEFRADGKVRVRLRFASGLRTIDGGDVRGFAIRGGTGEWVWAHAAIDGESVLVWADGISKPAAVRYAWAENPIISLESSARLPLRPFRTDTQSDK